MQIDNQTDILGVIDVQPTFMPGGELPVADGNTIIPVINQLLRRFQHAFATQDWHPQNHGSFASNQPGHEPGDVIELAGMPQVLWPDHCVQSSRGAEFHRDLDMTRVARVFRKGTDPQIDSYSGFFDNGHRKATGLGDYLRDQAVTDVYIMGLATDYCVRWSALDSLALGFRTFVIDDGCRGVELKPGDVDAAREEMRRAGVTIVQSGDIR